MPKGTESVFLKACRREPVPYTPVWLMRQAGRYQKSYRQIREKTAFLELCKNSDLACEVTLTAQKDLGADAAILFSDILVVVEPMGFSLNYLKGDGPSIHKAISSPTDVESVKCFDASQSLGFVGDTLKKIRKSLHPQIALVGFAGAPFTLASYLIEGGATKDFSKTKHFFSSYPSAWTELLDKLVKITVEYLDYQIRSGADALQLFDSWAGVLTPEEYRTYAAPYSKKVLAAIDGRVPTIHFGTKTGPFLERLAQAGGTVIGVDHRQGLDQAWQRIGYDRAIQGNMDPEILVKGSREVIQNEVKRILSQAAGRPGHIFNLGHGILPETPEGNARMLVEMVHEFSRQ